VSKKTGSSDEVDRIASSRYGFGALSRRNNTTAPKACKPIIAAVNGGAHGGGVELALGCDMIVAGDDARFSLPEVKRGVVAAQGGKRARQSANARVWLKRAGVQGIPRIVHSAGHQVRFMACGRVGGMLKVF
jgi:hypothetical protein